ncbi:MAG: helix-turn-helix domain-containing protein [Gemmatimonadota bacterium]|jgi:transcriptional regulator with XRE-family HTH domain
MDGRIEESPDPAIMGGIGRRLARLRKSCGLTQAEAAERAALDRSTVSRAEQGDNPTLLTVIRLLRVYGRLGTLEAFIPEPEVSPMALIRETRGGGRG